MLDKRTDKDSRIKANKIYEYLKVQKLKNNQAHGFGSESVGFCFVVDISNAELFS